MISRTKHPSVNTAYALHSAPLS